MEHTKATAHGIFMKHHDIEVIRGDDQVLLRKITDIRLSDCRLTETSFAAFLQDTTSVGSLVIFDDEIGNAGVYIRTIADADRCTALRSLEISYCKASLESLSTLSNSCKDLNKVSFEDCPQLLDEDVLALSEKCENITEFDLDTCKKITSASVAALMSNCNNLRRLTVLSCELVDHVAFLGLPEKVLEHLNVLSLSHCSLTDAAIPHIIRVAPMLQILNLCDCSITDAALPAISRLKSLRYLDVTSNADITMTGLQELQTRYTGTCMGSAYGFYEKR